MRQLRKITDLKGYNFKARDGDIGTLKGCYFDDNSWLVRYLVVRTGSWLLGRDVLLVPSVILGVDQDRKLIDVDLTCKQIESCPPVNTKLPVSRHYENEYYKYYGWEPYWVGELFFESPPHAAQRIEAKPPEKPQNPHLRSSDEVIGYQIEAQNGEPGHVAGLILDDEDWRIRYLIMDTKSWLPGKKVLISTPWAKTVIWAEQKIQLDVTCEQIESAPDYDPSKTISRDEEIRLYKHYGKTLE